MRAKLSPVVTATILLILATGISAGSGLGLMRVSFINVGQGDSTLIQVNGFDVLVDGGHYPAGPTVVAYLHNAGVDSLEVMVATHADTDHIGGLVDVLEDTSIAVGQLLYNGKADDINAFEEMMTAADARGIPVVVAHFPAEYNWGGVTAHVLNPAVGQTGEDNELSIVLLLDQGNVEYLLTGDIGTSTEAAIVARGTPVAADVLRVAHHGSKYSTSASFLAAVNPAEAVISVGKNSYGHPTEETLVRLQTVGVRIWRTDEVGTVIVNSDGLRIAVNEELPVDAILVFLPLVLSSEVGTAPTITPTTTATATSPTSTNTPTATGSPIPTATPTSTVVILPTITATATATPTATNTTMPPTTTPTATPTATTPAQGPCPCHANLLNCSDFSTQSQAQACFDWCISQGAGDIHRLDADDDGIACESLPKGWSVWRP